MILTDEQIAVNKETFLEFVNSIEREGMDKELLIKQLNGSDFFYAPASTKYHSDFAGGLCLHSINVYIALKKICQAMYTVYKDDNTIEDLCPYDDNTLKIVALFHDFDKMNKYERTVMNKKVYSDAGTKYDEMGKFDWVSVPGYKYKEYKDIFVMGTHGENSAYMTGRFIPLTTEEHCAIVNHHSIYDNPKLDVSMIFRRYPLACLLHLADMACTYVVEIDE